MRPWNLPYLDKHCRLCAMLALYNPYQGGLKMNRMHDIIAEIKKLEKELLLEIEKKEEQFFYTIKGKKVTFEEETRKYHKTLVTKISTYLRNASFLNILTVPIIWFCLLPAVVLDLTVSIFQCICFRIYGIPQVKRKAYIVIDRHNLSYLNPIEKLNCAYCGYFNGLVAYVQEIAGRTEQYWCPIKHARKLSAIHSRYHKFLEYGDCLDYQKRLDALRKDYNDIENHD